jgi:hypothetical protein
VGPDGDCTSSFPPCGDDLGGGSCRFALSGCAQKHAVFSDPNKAFRSSSGNLRRFGASSHLGVLRALSSWIQKTVVVVIVAVAVTIAVAVAVGKAMVKEPRRIATSSAMMCYYTTTSYHLPVLLRENKGLQ